MKMKKVLTILMVLALVAGFAFADGDPTPGTVNTGNHRLIVTSTVAEVVPQFKVTGSLSATNDKGSNVAEVADTEYAGAALASKLSIADNTIKVSCVIEQFQGVDATDNTQTFNYARYNKNITFTISASPLTQTSGLENGKTAKTVAGHIENLEVVAAETYQGNDGTGNNGTETTTQLSNKITNTETTAETLVTSVYNGRVNNQNIATFNAIWYADNTAPNGLYKADIIVAIAVN
jgi:hypothetical protein